MKGRGEKKFVFFTLKILFTLTLVIFLFGEREGFSSLSVNIDILLKRCAAYCERLQEAVLDYVCQEEITEELIYESRTRGFRAIELVSLHQTNHYIYDYQLIRKGRDFIEKRVLREENGQRRHVENASLKTRRFHHRGVIFGPIGLLSRSQQPSFDYQLLGKDKFQGNECLILGAKPKPGIKIKYLYGQLWISARDGSILKIEWTQQSLQNIETVNKIARSLGAQARIKFASEYGFEKNGLRFPSRYYVEERYFFPSPRRFIIVDKEGWQKHLRPLLIGPQKELLFSRVTVSYRDYRFFTVETRVIEVRE